MSAMHIIQFLRNISAALLVLGFGLNVAAVAEDLITVDRVEDPHSLPYRFEYLRRNLSPTGLPDVDREDLVVTNMDGDSIPDLCHILHDWVPHDSISAVIFTRLGVGGPALEQMNVQAPYVDNWIVCNLDDDPYDELVVTYVRHDTIWLQVLDPVTDTTPPQMLITGEDRNGDGIWDAWPDICGTIDVTGDGLPEVLVATEVGYDLYSRQLMCVDVIDREILWRYEFSGAVGRQYFHIGPLVPGGDTLLVFGVASKDNQIKANGMDDQHAYVVCLGLDGREHWRQEVGGRYLNARPQVVNVDSDPDLEVLCISGSLEFAGEDYTADQDLALAVIEPDGRWSGAFLSSATGLIKDLRLLFDDQDDTLIALTFAQDRSIRIFSDKGEPVRQGRFYSQPSIVAFANFLDGNDREFFLTTADGKVWLLSETFEPLAQHDGSIARIGTASRPLWSRSGIPFTVVREPSNELASVITFVPNPWYTIFFREPLLAFFAGFLPLAIIVILAVMYLVTIRRKNRQISETNRELSDTLQELRETQQKLIAAEKYKQARDIAGGFAHEIRNALFPARTWLTKLRKRVGQGTPADESTIRHVDDAIERAVNMTSLISEYTRLEAMVDRSATSVKKVLGTVLDDYDEQIKTQGVEVKISGDGDDRVQIGSEHLYTVFRNLLANSLDALTESEKPLISISYSRGPNTVTTVFADNGSGIEDDHVSRVFDAFFTTKLSTGTGVGLAIVKRVVDLYGGHISVESEYGRSTRFTLTLPAADATPGKGINETT